MNSLNSSLSRIKTLTRYYTLITFYDKSRFFLIVIWPIIDLLVWGFTTKFLIQSETNPSSFLSLILSTFIFWSLTIKAQQEISCQFMSDIFSRNLTNLLITPLKTIEILIALIASSIVKLVIVIGVLGFFAIILYSLNIFQFNFNILLIFINLLIFGWSLGIIATAFVVRFNYRVSFITWTLALLIQPISCVFYPRSILPSFLKLLSWFSPASYLFESMREIILKKQISSFNFYISTFLNIFYLIFSLFFFNIMLKWAKKKGSLSKM